MAMILCGECKQQVSSAADSCPHCGNPLKSKRGIFYYVFWGTLSLVITVNLLAIGFFFLTATGAGIWSGIRQAKKRAVAPTPAAVVVKWEHGTSTNSMDDSVTKTAMLVASSFKGGNGMAPTLVVRKGRKNVWEIYMSLGRRVKGEFADGFPNRVPGRIRWGKAEAERILLNPSSDNDAVFFPDELTRVFIALLSEGRTLLVEVPTVGDVDLIAEFNPPVGAPIP